MNVMVIGGSGATGKHVIEQLIQKGTSVKLLIRPTSIIPKHWEGHHQLTIIRKQLTELSEQDMEEYLYDCQAVACCLGHNMTWKGIYGQPRLVTKAVKLLCQAILNINATSPIRFVLMNTAGNKNRDLNEKASGIGERIIIALLRLLLPPHPDNEQAAEYLRTQVGQNNPKLEWVVVRPDNLTNDEQVSQYTLHQSPIRNAIFNPGKTSRINVGHFMAALITDSSLWQQWKGQMPVIYNREKE